MDNYRIIKPERSGCFAEAQESVLGQLEAFLAAEAAAGRTPVRIQFFLSDAQNQIGRLRERLSGVEGAFRPGNAGTGLPLRDTARPFARRGGQNVLAVPYLLIYLRDISEYAKIDAYMQARYPDIPRIILEARVCRPGWLIEMECETPATK